MAERAVVEYLANCAWQIPLLALGAWFLLKTVRPGVRVEHALWLSVLALSVVLPACGLRPYSMVAVLHSRPNVLRPHETVHDPYLSFPPSLEPDAQAVPLPGITTHAGTMPVAGATLRKLQLSVSVRRWLLALYGAAMMLAGLRFVRAWLSARRLVRESRALALPVAAMRELAECAARLRVALPALRETGAIAGPVVVGALRPALLLPERFAEHTGDEIRAALLHELAHVRRHDYLVNLVCQLAALPLAWHPATRAIQRRIRLTREMVCDEMAAQQMHSGASYAQCMVTLARQMLDQHTYTDTDTQTQALGLFEKATTGTMEERVMRLTEIEATEGMSGRAKAIRAATGVAAMLAVVAATLTFHLTPTFAATAAENASLTETDIQTGPVGVPVAAPAAVAASAPVAGPTAVPAAFQATLSEVKLAAPVGPVQQEKAAGVSSQAGAGDDWPTAVAGKGGYVHRWIGTDGRKYVTANQDPNEPSAEKRLEIEQNLNVSQKDLDEMNLDLAGLQKDLASTELKADLDEAKRLANDPKTKQQIREIQKQAAEIAKNAQLNLLNSPEWKKQMDELQKQMNDPAWQKQIAELEKNAQLKMLNSPEWKQQMDDLQKSMADMSAEMHLNSAAMQLKIAQSELSSPQVKDALAKAQKELESGEMKAKLDAAQKTLDEVRKQMEEMQKK